MRPISEIEQRDAVVSGELLIEGISVAYDKADVLENVSLRVRPKKITCLLGSNGSGKTTLIRAILSLTPPREGRIIFDGIELTGRPTHRVIAAGLACIPEGRRVFPKLSVEDNLRLGAYLERSTKLIAERVSAVFEIFPKLHERRRQLAGTLSGGEQAMVSIGRGLMAEPRLLLIDEPSLGLSPRLVDECFDVIDKVRAKGNHYIPRRTERASVPRYCRLRICAFKGEGRRRRGSERADLKSRHAAGLFWRRGTIACAPNRPSSRSAPSSSPLWEGIFGVVAMATGRDFPLPVLKIAMFNSTARCALNNLPLVRSIRCTIKLFR